MRPNMKCDSPYNGMEAVEVPREVITKKTQMFNRCVLGATGVVTVFLAARFLQSLLALGLSSPLFSPSPRLRFPLTDTCSDPCNIVLVESIPEGLVFNSSTYHPSIYQTWLHLIGEARSSLDIASFYWTLTNADTHTADPSANQGEEVLRRLVQLSERLPVRVAVNAPQPSQPRTDIDILSAAGADVRTVNMKELTTGVLHTKFWVVDRKHIYIGSANMDWRSLTQVKELGAVVYNCSCLAADLGKIFEAYWFLGQEGQPIPSPWPSSFSTVYNKDSPLNVPLNNTPSSIYLSSSPPSFCAAGRTGDLQSILSVMEDAEKFIYVAVMNYLPTMEFSRPKRYWAAIDTQLRRMAYERRVKVRLLISCWGSTQPIMLTFLGSLSSMQATAKLDVQVRLFVVPASPSQKKIPFARVNHNKYMVTDKVAYIGTSNWSGDYFVNTAGSGLVVNQTTSQSRQSTIQSQLQSVFERDWNSAYSKPLTQQADYTTLCPEV